jgi:hypothetical protein
MMSELAEYYSDVKEHFRKLKQANLEKAEGVAWGIDWEERTPYHWTIPIRKQHLNYWPSSRKMQLGNGYVFKNVKEVDVEAYYLQLIRKDRETVIKESNDD